MQQTNSIRNCRGRRSRNRLNAFIHRIANQAGFVISTSMFMLVLAAGPVSGADRTLEGVDLIDSENGFKILVKAADSEPITDYHMAYFHNPSRLLVDLAGKWDFPGYTVVKAENNTIQRIRVGEHPDKLRIAVDIKGNATLSPIIQEMPGAIALIIKDEYILRSGEEEVNGRLTDVRTETEAGVFKLILSGDRPIQEYKSYMITDEKPPKFVIDIPGNWENQGKSVLSVDGKTVTRIRIGKHSGYLRVVADLTEATPITPVIGKTGRELVLTIKQ